MPLPLKSALEIPPATRYLGPLINAPGLLRQQLTAQDWDATAALARKTLALARQSALQMQASEEARSSTLLRLPCGADAQGPADLLKQIKRYARSAGGRKLLAATAEALGTLEHAPDWLARDMAALAGGAKPSERLQSLGDVSTLVEGDAMWRKSTVATATRSLLVLCHCEYNVAFRCAARARALQRSAAALAGHAAATQARLQRLVTALHAASAGDRVRALRTALQRLLDLCERDLPRLAARLAPATLQARRARQAAPSPDAAAELGRATLEASHVLRVGLATYAACLELLTRPDRQSLLGAMAALPLAKGSWPAAALGERGASKLPGARGIREGSRVVVEGFVTGTFTWRSNDGKLHSMLQLLSPQDERRINAVCLYLHLEHRGIVPGAYCRVAGRFRRASKQAKGRAAIEVDRWDDKTQAQAPTWQNGLLRLAEPYYPVYPNGQMLAWALGPQRVMPDKQKGRSFWGAGEAVWAPVAHGWSKDYGQ